MSLTKSTLKDLLYIALFDLAITFLIWLPFLLKLNNFLGLDFSQGFLAIYRNFDGLEYVVIAKSLYNPHIIPQITYSLAPAYFPSHFPLYSLLMIPLAHILGYLKSMLIISVLFTILSAYAFYFLVKNFELTNHPLFLTLVFFLLPARWIIVHSVGSAETVFIFFSILTIYFFHKFEIKRTNKYIWLSGVSLFLAQLTRPPAILLFGALGLFVLIKAIKQKNLFSIIVYYPLLLGPICLLAMFFWFQLVLGNFWAYFHTGDNIHLTLPPFSMFNKNQYWVGDIWLEDIVYIFLLGFSGGIVLLKSKIPVSGYFVLTYLAATVFVAHRDIARYSLPVAPFVLIAFEKYINTKQFRLALLIIALGLYLYSQNFLIQNTAPIPNLNLYN